MKTRLLLSVFVTLMFCLIQLSAPVQAARPSEYLPQNRAEEWVLAQLIQGKDADLAQAFNPTERVLTAEFLEYVLTDPAVNAAISRLGIRISNATFTTPVDLNNAEIIQEVWLLDSRFEADIDISDCHFHKDLAFTGSVFSGAASFFQVAIDGDGYFIDTVFNDEVTFYQARISGDFIATGARFTHGDKTALFDEIHIGNTANIDRAAFFGPTSFFKADIGLELSGNQTRFFKTVNFNALSVGTFAHFLEAVFHDAVDFTAAAIGSQLDFTGADFTNPAVSHQFDYLTVGKSLSLQDTRVNGGMDFYSIDIGQDFFADGARFTSEEKRIDFYSASIGNNIRMSRAEFSGPVYFNSSRIANNLEATDAKFLSQYYGPVFDYMEVGNSVYFDNALFTGDVSISRCRIGADLYATGAIFLSPDVSLRMSDTKVGSGLWLRRTSFKGKLNIYDAEFTDLLIWDNSEDSGFITHIDLSRTKVTRDLRIEDRTVNSLVANSLVASGNVLLSNLTIVERAEMENTVINTLNVNNITWPAKQENFRIGGMNYQRIVIDNQPPTVGWLSLLEMANRASYDGQIYKNLENYIRREGNLDAADQIFIQQRRRERGELTPRTSLAWWWNGFLEVFVLYGKQPARAFLWSLLIVLIGTAVFRKEVMVPKTDEPTRPSARSLWRKNPGSISVRSFTGGPAKTHYSPFWYSLDLFLPIVELRTAEGWMPDPDRRWINHYQKIHIILGWLLVTIGVLAVTGIVA